MNRDLIFDSLRNCVSDQKCKGCEWVSCKAFGNKTRMIHIPLDLALAVLSMTSSVIRLQDEKHYPEEIKGIIYNKVEQNNESM